MLPPQQTNAKFDNRLKQVAMVLLQETVSALNGTEVDRQVAIHTARKGCKRFRGFLRLVKSAFRTDFSSVDAGVRNAAFGLSSLRDKDVLVKRLAELRKLRGKSISAADFATIQNQLTCQNTRSGKNSQTEEQQIADFLTSLQAVVEQIPNWNLRCKMSKAARVGFRQTYRQGHKALKLAWRRPSTDNLHRWRKWVKYHEHQMRFMSDSWKGNAAERIERLQLLSEVLGDDHDLAIILEKIEAQSIDRKTAQFAGYKKLLQAISTRRERLQSRAFKLGRLLYRRRPAELMNKLGRRPRVQLDCGPG